jgi:hypothetical protein
MERKLLPEEKLAILQASDPRREWLSLDDQRVCVLCGRALTGRQIEIAQGPSGAYSLRCPTSGCPALPNDWFYLSNASPNVGQSSATQLRTEF